MERRDRSGVAAFFWSDPVAPGAIVPLSDDALRHALVRRLGPGDRLRLVSGLGAVAHGRVAVVTRSGVTVTIDNIEAVTRPTLVDVLVPIADRERMLWAAEKCAEHQVTSWRPVLFARSRSVANRGEGAKFAGKVAARMKSALEQCGGAWMPQLLPEADLSAALEAVPTSHRRIVLDPDGEPLSAMNLDDATAIAIGPEGGFEASEVQAAVERGWRPASLGSSVLRFETAIVSAVAVIRAAQLKRRSP